MRDRSKPSQPDELFADARAALGVLAGYKASSLNRQANQLVPQFADLAYDGVAWIRAHHEHESMADQSDELAELIQVLYECYRLITTGQLAQARARAQVALTDLC